MYALKTAAEPLEIGTWLLLTAYKNSSSSYLTPIYYDVLFSHNIHATERETETTDRHNLEPQARPRDHKYGQPKTEKCGIDKRTSQRVPPVRPKGRCRRLTLAATHTSTYSYH